ncbi:hypothetical protein ACHAXS_001862 [Conticribra weissflogii]
MGKSKDANKSDDPRIGAKRIPNYICAKYQSEIIEVTQFEGIAISGVMDEISAAAMWTDAGVTKSQSFTILQHLRSSLGRKVTVPYFRNEYLSIGVSIPQTGSIEWQDPESGRIDTIQFEYKSMLGEFKFVLTKLLTSHGVKADDVDEIDFVIGGKWRP